MNRMGRWDRCMTPTLCLLLFILPILFLLSLTGVDSQNPSPASLHYEKVHG